MSNSRFHIVWEDGLRSEQFDDICHLANAVEQAGPGELAEARLVMTSELESVGERASCSGSFLFALAECYADSEDGFQNDAELFAEICNLGEEDE